MSRVRDGMDRGERRRMKRSFEDVKRLETIRIKLEKIPIEKQNAIIDDLKWATEELLKSWRREEAKP